ncbi:hypothetical protein SDC9_18831 [bioreactor metagenome]|uniref:Uncharacterized protein n=1 Tax=bioreactor metagenome TaxID=1076179 RepID=A0A644U1B8_9ZZZZ
MRSPKGVRVAAPVLDSSRTIRRIFSSTNSKGLERRGIRRSAARCRRPCPMQWRMQAQKNGGETGGKGGGGRNRSESPEGKGHGPQARPSGTPGAAPSPAIALRRPDQPGARARSESRMPRESRSRKADLLTADAPHGDRPRQRPVPGAAGRAPASSPASQAFSPTPTGPRSSGGKAASSRCWLAT